MIPHIYLLSCSSTLSHCCLFLVLFLLTPHSPDFSCRTFFFFVFLKRWAVLFGSSSLFSIENLVLINQMEGSPILACWNFMCFFSFLPDVTLALAWALLDKSRVNPLRAFYITEVMKCCLMSSDVS